MAFIFGVGTLTISATAGQMTIGKVQSVSLNITYEQAQLRGSTDIFSTDTQFYDGNIEGSFEHADIDLSNMAIMLTKSGTYVDAAGSGTWTITSTVTPGDFQLDLEVVTNGITSTVNLPKVRIPSLTLDFSRTEYTIPSMNFVAEETGGTLMTWVQ